MPFYKALTPYYDQIFPANEKAVSFLSSHFKEGGSILDVGAGTGNMAISLSHEGFQVTATEPEEEMAEEIRLKSKSCPSPVSVATKTMQQLGEFPDFYDGIYCIGNTLVHLNTLAQINTFIEQTYQKLSQDGVFIFQIVNFDKVLNKKDFTFPIIEKDSFTFQRHYEISGEHILFTTTLTEGEYSQRNTVPLYPATSAQLLPLLKQSGFTSIDVYGSFAYKAYSIDTPALIVIAKK